MPFPPSTRRDVLPWPSIRRAGDVIPQVLGRVSGSAGACSGEGGAGGAGGGFVFPSACPACGTPVVKEEVGVVVVVVVVAGAVAVAVAVVVVVVVVVATTAAVVVVMFAVAIVAADTDADAVFGATRCNVRTRL